MNSKQEVSSKMIIVEANMALLSLNDSGKIKGSKLPNDRAALTQEGPKCPKNRPR